MTKSNIDKIYPDTNKQLWNFLNSEPNKFEELKFKSNSKKDLVLFLNRLRLAKSFKGGKYEGYSDKTSTIKGYDSYIKLLLVFSAYEVFTRFIVGEKELLDSEYYKEKLPKCSDNIRKVLNDEKMKKFRSYLIDNTYDYSPKDLHEIFRKIINIKDQNISESQILITISNALSKFKDEKDGGKKVYGQRFSGYGVYPC